MINNKYFIDTEFIEDGNTIELISIAIVTKNRTLYYQNSDCNFSKADDWIKQHVYTGLISFDKDTLTPMQNSEVWLSKKEIANKVTEFITGENVELWGHYASYDFVVLCQLYGKMLDIPKHIPDYINDVLQLQTYKRLPLLVKQNDPIHNALVDAQYIKSAYCDLMSYSH